MNKITRHAIVLLTALFVVSLTGCPAPDGSGSNSSTGNPAETPQFATGTPSISIVVSAGCSASQVTVTYNGNFGAVKTLEIYKAGAAGSFTKIATLTGITGPRTYYPIGKLANGHYRFYARALRAANNTWYTSAIWNFQIVCSGDGNGSGSSSGGPG